jgi:IS605 OrfB family transposase
MLSLNLPIIHNSDTNFVEDKMNQHAYAFRYMFRTLDESGNRQYDDNIKNKFKLNDTEYSSLETVVKTFFKQCETNNKKTQKRINNKLDEIEELKTKQQDPKKFLTKKEKRSLHKLQEQVVYLKGVLKNKPVFGGRKNLQHLTHLHNQYNTLVNNLSVTTDETEIILLENELVEQFDKIEKQKNKYVTQRLRSFYLLGEANQKGNRFFDFIKLNEGLLVYKPKQGTKVNLTVKVCKNELKLVNKLIELSQTKNISLSVYLSNKSVSIAYDDDIVNGWTLDETEKKQKIKEIKETYVDKELQTTLIKAVYSEHHRKVEQLKLEGKIEGRCVAIDMNPSYIGVAILERDYENEDTETGKHAVKVIHKFCYSLKYFIQKLPKEATEEEREYLRNKQKHEIKELNHHLFNVANHYKCSSFVMEDLNFNESKETLKKGKEANRQTKNVWYRGLFTQMIMKLTSKYGIKLIEVEPSYSSFIGNIMYKNFDPINSAIEIGRRGLYKFIKNCAGLPQITEGILNTVAEILLKNGEDVSKMNKMSKVTWKNLFNLLKKYRWRGSSDLVTSRCRMSTKKSRVKILS